MDRTACAEPQCLYRVHFTFFYLYQENKISLLTYENLSARKAEIFVSLLSTFSSVHRASTFWTFYVAFELYRHF